MSHVLCGVTNTRMGIWDQVQKLTPCRNLLQQCCDEYLSRYRVRLEIDDRNFTTAFFAWLDVLLSNRDYRDWNEPDYFQFSFGALLRELLHRRVVHVATDASAGSSALSSALSLASVSPDNTPVWWPAGYMLTHFCFELLKQTLRQKCGIELKLDEVNAQPALWKSFRENLLEEPSLAIAYFDKFVGLEPNWREPSMVVNRPNAGRFGKGA
ncbi:hypothetical protein AAGS40_21485 [Paraburkholderia sp. PREW-6R]|uniref:hypothetical protein n=1 Tax=Paraburkholderia sp. PREW-6R TaxID=3141544 RepID=UPI0031F51798